MFLSPKTMPAWWEKQSNPSRKREEHQSFSEDWKRIEKPYSSRHLAKNRGTETGFGSGSDSDGVLEKRGHPLPRPTHDRTVTSSVSSISSLGSSNGQPDYGFIGPCRYSDPMTLTRGSINSGSPRQQQGQNRHPFMSDLLPDMSASPRSEHGQPLGEATPPTIKAFCSPRASPEVKFNPRSRSPMPAAISKGQTNQTSPFISRACGYSPESSKEQQDDRKNLGHPLPLPPSPPSSPPSYILRNNAANKSVQSLHSRWKKGKLLGRGTFGDVYLGFNSKNGGMCAIKEVRVISDDTNSSECLRQLNKEIFLLSQLTHRNIVRYYGSELNDSTLSVYLEYVPGGSIHKLLQEYGPFKEPVIQSYTRQILSGLFYLHARNTVHRDIKGANILVGPNGEIKLADFGMAKHITPSSSSVLSFKGSPCWMAPEVIMNCDGYHLAVDIWSLGCTILEMATSKPPWSQYEGVAAIFKIGNSKEIPQVPDHLSDDGKDFLKLCLQRDPSARPTAAQLLQHPFIYDEASLRNAKININGGIMQPNSDVSSMPEQNKPVVHSNQKITTKCEEYSIRHMGGLPMDSKTSRYSKDIFFNMGFGIDDYSSITVISRAEEGVHASRQVGYCTPLNGLCVEG